MSCYLNKLFSLQGKVAAVTGTKNQISNAIANGLIRSGSEVYDLNRHPLSLVKSSKQSDQIFAEINHCSSFGSFCQELAQKKYRLNILVNVLEITNIYKFIPDTLQQESYVYPIVKNNLGDAFYNSKQATAIMKQSGFNSVINVISLVQPDDFGEHYDYVPLQKSLNIITKQWASDLIKDNVCVNNLVLANISNKLEKELTYLNYKQDREETLMGTIIFLASQTPLYITGQNFFHFFRR